MLRTSARVERYDLDEAAATTSATLAVDLRLRGADAPYVALGLHLGLPLVTWDQEQMTRAASVIQTRTP
jgi:predicted nucleic acid-binding protein